MKGDEEEDDAILAFLACLLAAVFLVGDESFYFSFPCVEERRCHYFLTIPPDRTVPLEICG